MVMNVVAGVLALLLFVGCVLVTVGTFRRNKWGINTSRVVCPSCGNTIAPARVPKTLKQALWGGATCDKCSADIDKWGRQLAHRRVQA